MDAGHRTRARPAAGARAGTSRLRPAGTPTPPAPAARGDPPTAARATSSTPGTTSAVPAASCVSSPGGGRATFYLPPPAPAGYRSPGPQAMVTAVAEYLWEGSAVCGRCARVTGPAGDRDRRDHRSLPGRPQSRVVRRRRRASRPQRGGVRDGGRSGQGGGLRRVGGRRVPGLDRRDPAEPGGRQPVVVRGVRFGRPPGGDGSRGPGTPHPGRRGWRRLGRATAPSWSSRAMRWSCPTPCA